MMEQTKFVAHTTVLEYKMLYVVQPICYSLWTVQDKPVAR